MILHGPWAEKAQYGRAGVASTTCSDPIGVNRIRAWVVAGDGKTAARLPALHALRVDIERIDRVARRHEQPVALDAAEADVGGALGQRDETDRLAVRVENF